MARRSFQQAETPNVSALRPRIPESSVEVRGLQLTVQYVMVSAEGCACLVDVIVLLYLKINYGFSPCSRIFKYIITIQQEQ